MSERPPASEQACISVLQSLFDQPAEIMRGLAPKGWAESPLRLIFHPTAQQKYEQSMRLHENLRGWGKKDAQTSERPEPQLADFTTDPPDAGNPMDELLELLGDCTWLIFSNNHSVFDADGLEYHLGSFRGSGGFIADFLNEHFPSDSITYDYMDFYCAGAFSFDRADTTPVFDLLFRRMKAIGLDWEYSFPRTMLLDLNGLRKDEPADDPAHYDAAKAMEQQLEAERNKADVARFQEKLDEVYREEYESAKYKLPPPEVRAYRTVYGKLPDGFPQI
ncbi:MAG: hypothetical protein IPM98_07250 [Lewinellaceae bacterium]|nr:hypothetical protein [Lewinellaceae bacterium]